MKLTSKYNLGDQVWYVGHPARVTRQVPCVLCNATGKLTLTNSDKTPTCPDCYGSREITEVSVAPECPVEMRTIGLVRVERRLGDPPKVEYMAHETGIGTGFILPEDQLYATEDEAREAARTIAERSHD